MNRTLIYGLTSLVTVAGVIGVGQSMQKTPSRVKDEIPLMRACIMHHDKLNDGITKKENQSISLIPPIKGEGIYVEDSENGRIVVVYAPGITVGGYGPIEKAAIGLCQALQKEGKQISVWFENNGFTIDGNDAKFIYRTNAPRMETVGFAGSIYVAKEEMMKDGALFYDYDGNEKIDGFDLMNVIDSSQYRPIQDVATSIKEDLSVIVVKQFYHQMKK